MTPTVNPISCTFIIYPNNFSPFASSTLVWATFVYNLLSLLLPWPGFNLFSTQQSEGSVKTQITSWHSSDQRFPILVRVKVKVLRWRHYMIWPPLSRQLHLQLLLHFWPHWSILVPVVLYNTKDVLTSQGVCFEYFSLKHQYGLFFHFH